MSVENDLYFLDFERAEESAEVTQGVADTSTHSVEANPHLLPVRSAGRIAVTNSDLYDAFKDNGDESDEQNGLVSATSEAFTEQTIPTIISTPDLTVSNKITYPAHIASRAEDAISLAMQMEGRVFFHLDDLIAVTEHYGKLSAREKWEFKEACKSSPNLEYLDNRRFGLRERLNPDNYWPGIEEKDVRTEELDTLFENVVEAMSVAGLKGRRQFTFSTSHIMGIVKSQGFQLNPYEHGKLIDYLTTHPSILPEPDCFRFKHESYVTNNKAVNKVTSKEKQKNSFAVSSPRKIHDIINKINSLPELKAAKDSGKKAKSDTRTHGKNKKSRGGQLKSRHQGKKIVTGQSMAALRKSV